MKEFLKQQPVEFLDGHQQKIQFQQRFPWKSEQTVLEESNRKFLKGFQWKYRGNPKDLWSLNGLEFLKKKPVKINLSINSCNNSRGCS